MVSVIVTSLVLSLAWASGIDARFAGDSVKSDEAFYAAEGALQWAVFQMRQDPSWRPTGQTPVVNGYTCTISYTDLGTPAGMLGNPLRFTAVATRSGVDATGTSSATVAGVLAYVPQFWTLGNLSIAQSATIKGDVETMGKLTITPPASGAVVTKGAKGKIKAKKDVQDTNPTGSATYFTYTPVANSTDVTPPSMTAAQVFNALKNGPTVPLSTVLIYDSAGHPILDFSKAGGKPVYYNGPASYVGSVGIKNSSNPANDTFLIDNTANFTGTYPFNAPTAQMNLLINGDVVFNGSGTKGISITGSFYVTGSWTQQGTYNFNGTIMCDNNSVISGSGTIDVSVPPSFDPRYIPRITSYIGRLP
jgi:hypothetical protein